MSGNSWEESGYQKPITIAEAIKKISSNYFLLPSIQRRFVWSAEQIEMLFDSLLQDFPMNTFMFWHIEKDSLIKNENKFYRFLSKYREYFQEENEEFNTKTIDDFIAVIDGQQRLNSLYIGLAGTYAFHMPRKHWKNDQFSLPDRKLYLGTEESVGETEGYQKKYDFKFLTEDEYKRTIDSGNYVFPVPKILEFTSFSDLSDYLDDNDIPRRSFGRRAIEGLYLRIKERPLITFYLENDNQDIDRVLEIFLRTNSGGTPLSSSALLMSILTTRWKKIDARECLKRIVDEVYEIYPGRFFVSQDFILKTCLVLFSNDIKFKLKNFESDTIARIEDNWDRVHLSIISAFNLINTLGFNHSNLKSYNAVIPLVYYIYKCNLESIIDKATYNNNERRTIQVWLNLSILKGIFGGQSDGTLSKMRRVINSNVNAGIELFPAKQIADEFSTESRNYDINDELIERELLFAQYGTYQADCLLYLLYPNLNYYNQDFHRDHMHAQSYFNSKEALAELHKIITNEEEFEFASNPSNWNSIANLQFLNASSNESKQAKTLSEWVDSQNITPSDLIISNNNISLDIKDFKRFIEDRRSEIKKRLKNCLL